MLQVRILPGVLGLNLVAHRAMDGGWGLRSGDQSPGDGAATGEAPAQSGELA